jgi:putative Mg2+ transporter-C (MgtC) family protein
VDPTRLAQGVVTGVGFLGAGAIIQSGMSVQGLTTAATIWLVCAVGASVGGGLWQIGVVGAIIALVLLRGLSFLDRAANKVGRGSKDPEP